MAGAPRPERPAAAGEAATSEGSAAVELALVLPLALLFPLALVQVGLLAKDALVVIQAAREGAREAAVSTDQDRVEQAALRGSGLPAERTDVTVDRAGGGREPVTGEVTYGAPMVVPLGEGLSPDEVAGASAATMRQETPGSEP